MTNSFGKNTTPRLDDDLADLDLTAIPDTADLDLPADLDLTVPGLPSDDDLDFNLDDVDDPAAPRPRPKRSAKGFLLFWLVILLLGGGGTFAYLTFGDQIAAMISGHGQPAQMAAAPTPPAAPSLTPLPVEGAAATPPDALAVPIPLDPAAPVPAPSSDPAAIVPPAPAAVTEPTPALAPAPETAMMTPMPSDNNNPPAAVPPAPVPESVAPSNAAVPAPAPTPPTPVAEANAMDFALPMPEVAANTPDPVVPAPAPKKADVKQPTPPLPSTPDPALDLTPPAAPGKTAPDNKGDETAKGIEPIAEPVEDRDPPPKEVDGYLEEPAPVQAYAKKTAPAKLEPQPTPTDRMLGVTVTPNTSVPNPESDLAMANKALELGRYQAALDLFQNLYKKNKSDQRILMGRAVALQKLGLNTEAIRAYDDLLAVVPDNPDVLTNMLGLLRRENPALALQRLLDLRQRFPQNPMIAAQVGLANASVGNLEEGLRYLGMAASLEGDNPKHFFNMGVIAERLNKPTAAIGYYERALQADALNDNPAYKLQRELVYDRLSVLRDKL